VIDSTETQRKLSPAENRENTRRCNVEPHRQDNVLMGNVMVEKGLISGERWLTLEQPVGVVKRAKD
jgi:hypothetical protein